MNRRAFLAAASAFAVLGTPAMADPRTYHVNPLGDDRAPGTESDPLRTVGAALRMPLLPGCAVAVHPGSYREALFVGKAGRAGLPISIYSVKPGAARIDARDTGKIAVQIARPWVEFSGFDVVGHKNRVAIAVAPAAVEPKPVHHVGVLGNIVRGAGGSGIYARMCEFVTIADNDIYDCAYASAGSGISIHLPLASSGLPYLGEYRFVVERNRVSRCVMRTDHDVIPHSDGHGIILDDFEWIKIPAKTKRVPYPYPARLEDNICFLNGGNGYLVYRSRAKHLLRHNIGWGNGTDPLSRGPYGAEFANIEAVDAAYQRNIGVARQRAHSAGASRDGEATWNGNVFFAEADGARVFRADVGGAPDNNWLGVDPDFADPPRDFTRRAA